MELMVMGMELMVMGMELVAMVTELHNSDLTPSRASHSVRANP